MNYFLTVPFIALTVINSACEAHNASCVEQCNTAFGTFIGQSLLTKAYSNCSGNCVKHDDNFVVIPKQNDKLFTGMKWQCVEYSRRWLIENRGITFGNVEYAYHIWDLTFGEAIDTHTHVPLLRFTNKTTTESPQVGDLLIYSNALAITGHVAVIVSVNEDNITIAEQNYFNRLWEGKDYARRLLLDRDAQGHYRIFDDSLIGWVRFKR